MNKIQVPIQNDGASRGSEKSDDGGRPLRVMTVFGTRPEVIKVAPVVRAMEEDPRFTTINVGTGQHSQLMGEFAEQLGVRLDVDLKVGQPGQTLVDVHGRILSGLGKVIPEAAPDVLLVQGDTTSAAAGALAGFYHGVGVGHIEAGLRSGRFDDPFPEEVHRRVIGQLASYNFAVTAENAAALRREGVDESQIAIVGNPVVDAVRWAVDHGTPGPRSEELLKLGAGGRMIALTTHRRESFGDRMSDRLRELANFVNARPDVSVVFPVHPNPHVREAAEAVFGDCDRIHMVEPLGYFDFVNLLSSAWLIVTDSGGVQEEAPSLGKPVLVIRETTERPDGVRAGVARLIAGGPGSLANALETAESDGWPQEVQAIPNPYGDGHSGSRIASWLLDHATKQKEQACQTQPTIRS